MSDPRESMRDRAFLTVLLFVGAAAAASGLYQLIVEGDSQAPAVFDTVLGLAVLLVTWAFLSPYVVPSAHDDLPDRADPVDRPYLDRPIEPPHIADLQAVRRLPPAPTRSATAPVDPLPAVPATISAPRPSATLPPVVTPAPSSPGAHLSNAGGPDPWNPPMPPTVPDPFGPGDDDIDDDESDGFSTSAAPEPDLTPGNPDEMVRELDDLMQRLRELPGARTRVSWTG